MVCDALTLAQEPLGIRDAVAEGADIQLYLHLDDSLLQQLQALKADQYECARDISKVSCRLFRLLVLVWRCLPLLSDVFAHKGQVHHVYVCQLSVFGPYMACECVACCTGKQLQVLIAHSTT